MSYIISTVDCIKKASVFSTNTVRLWAENLKRISQMGGVTNLCNNQLKLEKKTAELLTQVAILERENSILLEENEHVFEQREASDYKNCSLVQQNKELTNEIKDLKYKLTNSFSLDQSLWKIKKNWLDYQINQIKESSFGSGPHWEFYAERKQNAIDCLINQNKFMFTENEIVEIKQAQLADTLLG